MTDNDQRRFHREISWLREPERIASLEVDRVIDLALEGLQDIQSVLDVGTGSAIFAEQFAARGLQADGVDANPEMLPVALQFVPKGTFKEGVAESLPFPDAAYDLVFMGMMLHEVDDLLISLQEAYRVGKKRLVVLDWPDEEGPNGPPSYRRLSMEKMTTQGSQAGFTQVSQTRLNTLVLYCLEH